VCTPPNTCFLESTGIHNPNDTSIGSAIFAQLMAECRRACPGMYFPLKIKDSHWGSGPHLIMVSWAHPSPNPKRHLNCFSRFCTTHCRVYLYFTMGCPFSPQDCPFPCGNLDPHLTHGSLGPPKSSHQTASQSDEPFLQGSLQQIDRPR